MWGTGIARSWEAEGQHRGPSSVPCDDRRAEVDGGGRGLKREAVCVRVWLIHFVVQQKLTHCKAIILQ